MEQAELTESEVEFECQQAYRAGLRKAADIAREKGKFFDGRNVDSRAEEIAKAIENEINSKQGAGDE